MATTGMPRRLGFVDRDLFLVGVDDEHQVGGAAHIADTAESLVELFALALEVQAFLLGEALSFAAEDLIELAQALDRVGDRLPVRHHAAEPARVDVVLGRTLGAVGDDLGRLALGADEENAAAASNGVADDLKGARQHRNGLCQVDDVNVITIAEDIRLHLRVPAVRLVAEVDACLKKLAHREIGQCHAFLSFSG